MSPLDFSLQSLSWEATESEEASMATWNPPINSGLFGTRQAAVAVPKAPNSSLFQYQYKDYGHEYHLKRQPRFLHFGTADEAALWRRNHPRRLSRDTRIKMLRSPNNFSPLIPERLALTNVTNSVQVCIKRRKRPFVPPAPKKRKTNIML